MAKFPIYINNIRFLVNPTKIKIEKTSQIAELRTHGGTIFQVWPDLPDTITFSGIAFGNTAYSELRDLRDRFETPGKEIILTYKGVSYRAIIKKMSIEGDAEKPRQFSYSFDIILVEPAHFKSEDLGIGAEIEPPLSVLEKTFSIAQKWFKDRFKI
jgi:hypothetical protein